MNMSYVLPTAPWSGGSSAIGLEIHMHADQDNGAFWIQNMQEIVDVHVNYLDNANASTTLTFNTP